MSDKRLKKQPAQSDDQLRIIINSMADGVVIVDETGILKFMNPAAEKLFNLSAADMVEQMFGFPLVNEDVEKTELSILNPNIEGLVVELRVVDIIWNEKKAVLATLRDITERKQAEKAERLSESLENLRLLAGAIAHEFSQPLQILGCLFDIMEMEQGVNDRLTKCKTNAERISTLVRQLRNVVILEKQNYLDGEILDLAASSNYTRTALADLVFEKINIPKLSKDQINDDRQLKSSKELITNKSPHSGRNESMRNNLQTPGLQKGLHKNPSENQSSFATSEELFSNYLLENRATKEDVEAIFAQIDQPIISLDSDGVIKQVNKHAETIFGRKADELVGLFIGMFSSKEAKVSMNIIQKGGKVLPAVVSPLDLEVFDEKLTLAVVQTDGISAPA